VDGNAISSSAGCFLFVSGISVIVTFGELPHADVYRR
jgi:hypothetical protein